jgi:hypothetical protein
MWVHVFGTATGDATFCCQIASGSACRDPPSAQVGRFVFEPKLATTSFRHQAKIVFGFAALRPILGI